MLKKNTIIRQRKNCYFCLNAEQRVDYKDAQILRRFLSSYAKIRPRRKSGLCAKHQRKMAEAIKRARIMALIPFLKR
ncbi:MAG: 30S ribosomal protein S18 [bacterium]